MEVLESSNATLSPGISSVAYTAKGLVTMVPDWTVTSVIILMCIAIIVGIPGNSLVLAVLTRSQPKTSTDWFIIHIAVCDLISLTVNEPLDIVRYQSSAWAQIGSATLCKVHYYVLNVLFINSNFLLLFVGLDRYFKTCRPHGSYFTPSRAFRVCIGMTLGSMICAAPSLYTSSASADSGACIFDKNYLQVRAVFSVSLTVLIVISSGLLVLIYTRIAIVLKRQMQADKVRRETARRILASSEQEQLAFAGLHGTSEPPAAPSIHSQPPRLQMMVEDLTRDDSLRADISTNETGVDETGAKGPYLTEPMVSNKIHRTDLLTSPIASSSIGSHANNDGERRRKTSAVEYLRGYIQRKTSRIQPTPRNSSPSVAQTQTTSTPNTSLSCADEYARRANKTTQMMFAITLLYIVATVIPTSMALFLTETDLRSHSGGKILIFLTLRLYTVNHFVNPLMYMCMSSVFRKKALRILKSIKP